MSSTASSTDSAAQTSPDQPKRLPDGRWDKGLCPCGCGERVIGERLSKRVAQGQACRDRMRQQRKREAENLDRLDAAPFREWLRRNIPDDEPLGEWAAARSVDRDQIRRIRNGTQKTVSIDTVDPCLIRSGTSLGELYPEKPAPWRVTPIPETPVAQLRSSYQRTLNGRTLAAVGGTPLPKIQPTLMEYGRRLGIELTTKQARGVELRYNGYSRGALNGMRHAELRRRRRMKVKPRSRGYGRTVLAGDLKVDS